jgi:23S rRNA (uracil1939-C5)-methyltransferase
MEGIITLKIESLSSSGPGVGYLFENGIRHVVFVPLTVPGDLIKANLVSKEKIYYNAELVEIIEKSKDRIDPLCPVFGECGGCDWQCVSYAVQIDSKKNLLSHNLKTAKIDVNHIEVIPAKNPFFYRDKIRVAIDNTTKTFGFFGRKSNDYVAVSKCFISNDALNQIFVPPFLTNYEFKIAEESFAYDYSSKEIVFGNQGKKCFYSVDGFNIAFYPDTFVQNNLLMNEVLVTKVVSFVGSNINSNVLSCAHNGTVLELYAGNGNFTLPLSRKNKKVIAVEGNDGSISLMKFNLTENKITNVTPVEFDVDYYVAEKHKEKQRFDCIILDPPRSGCNCISEIGDMTSKIVYVSCNGKTLIRDTKILISKGFSVSKVVLIDMFPQTKHYETIFVLEKKSFL